MTARFSKTEREGVNKVESIFINRFNWIFREQTTSDFGIDAQVEHVDEKQNPTGKLIGLQIKTGLSHFLEKDDAFVYYIKKKHHDYWINHSLNVLLVGYIPEYRITIWTYIDQSNVQKTKRGFKILIPKANLLDSETSKNKITQVLLSNDNKLKKIVVEKHLVESHSVSVSFRGGNLFAGELEGKEKQLTYNRSDLNPILLKNERKVIFLREVKENDFHNDYVRLKIMSVNIDNYFEHTITEMKPYKDGLDNTNEILNIISLELSIDQQFLYFVTEKSATSCQLVKVNIANGKWTELFPVVNYKLIRKGVFRSFFLISSSKIQYRGKECFSKICNEEGEVLKEFEKDTGLEDLMFFDV